MGFEIAGQKHGQLHSVVALMDNFLSQNNKIEDSAPPKECGKTVMGAGLTLL
jgi:hypothetical protein